MNRNEAAAQIASAAMEQVRRIAIEAMAMLNANPQVQQFEVSGAPATIVTPVSAWNISSPDMATQPPIEAPSQEAKRPRGRPRKTDASTAAPVVTVVEDEDAETELDLPMGQESTVEASKPEPTVFNIETMSFPAFSDQWFQENLETARNHCRAILSVRHSVLGSDKLREELRRVTGKMSVTSFEWEDAKTYYQYGIKALANG